MSKKKIKLISVILFFLGLLILLYPTISQYFNMEKEAKVIEKYNNTFLTNKKDYTSYFDEANTYNEKLYKLNYPFLQYNKLSNYSDLLNINNDGMMGYIKIDKIKVELPIYHGTSSAVLNAAVGHLEGSSLPVGGKSTHSVLSAHRALPTSRLFTDLNKLEIGDTFEITIIDRTFTYQVDKISIVEPNDTSSLQIIEGSDYVTLMTCTPYGINTHRLLVRGKKIENIDNKKIYVTSEAFKINTLIVTTLLTLLVVIILLLILYIRPTRIIKNKLCGGKYEKN